MLSSNFYAVKNGAVNRRENPLVEHVFRANSEYTGAVMQEFLERFSDN